MTWLKGWAATALAYALAGLAVVGGVLSVLAGQRKRGRREAIQEGQINAAERVEKGREAVADGRKRGSPDDRVQHNDTAW